MLTTCSAPGCRTLVMGGGRCVSHEPHLMRGFIRGRPFLSAPPTLLEATRQEPVAFAGSGSLQRFHGRSLRPKGSSEVSTPGSLQALGNLSTSPD